MYNKHATAPQKSHQPTNQPTAVLAKVASFMSFPFIYGACMQKQKKKDLHNLFLQLIGSLNGQCVGFFPFKLQLNDHSMLFDSFLLVS